MSEMMRPMAFGDLVETALAEYEKSGSIFGIPQEKFYGEKGDLQVCKPVKVCGTKIGSAHAACTEHSMCLSCGQSFYRTQNGSDHGRRRTSKLCTTTLHSCAR